MIRINLASRKQSSALTSVGTMTAAKSAGKVSLNMGSFGDLPIAKLLLPVLVYFGANYYLSDFKATEIGRLEQAVEKVTKDKVNLEVMLAKTKGYEDIKRSLDADEKLIRTKLDTIKKLVSDRSTPPKILAELSRSIPADVWLTEFKIENGRVSIKGGSLGYNQVSDFMKGLNDSAYFKDIELKNSTQAKDESGKDLTQFELEANRRLE